MMSATPDENVSHPLGHDDPLPGGADPGLDLGKLDLQVADKLCRVLLVANEHIIVRRDRPADPHVAREIDRLLISHVPNAAALQPLSVSSVDGQERDGWP